MARLSKRVKANRALVDPCKVYSIDEALKILGSTQKAKFVESVEAAVCLGIDSRKSDQSVRSSVVLPHGTGQTTRVAVFAQGDAADQAKAAGADIVGFDDLAEQIKSGQMDFDILIATPDAMRVIGKLGQILGPRNLMPNPKVGTVTTDVTKAVENAKAGQVRFRADKNGIVHCCVGKVDFSPEKLVENVKALLSALRKAKPASAKGIYLKKLVITSTMGPGIVVDLSALVA
jgi:large subunit ribosomal protein L1